jgi:HAD superfamily phosphatase (TIGR01668 family)
MAKPLLRPDLYVRSVQAIDLDILRSRGIDCLLVDLDNTLLPRDTNVVPGSAKAWSARLADAGFRACLVSNNWHERVHAVASELGFEMVDKALKPLPFAFRRGLRRLGAEEARTAVIGDQLFTDVLGGNMLGMFTVMVSPLSRTDLPHTLLLRKLETIALRGCEPSD